MVTVVFPRPMQTGGAAGELCQTKTAVCSTQHMLRAYEDELEDVWSHGKPQVGGLPQQRILAHQTGRRWKGEEAHTKELLEAVCRSVPLAQSRNPVWHLLPHRTHTSLRCHTAHSRYTPLTVVPGCRTYLGIRLVGNRAGCHPDAPRTHLASREWTPGQPCATEEEDGPRGLQTLEMKVLPTARKTVCRRTPPSPCDRHAAWRSSAQLAKKKALGKSSISHAFQNNLRGAATWVQGLW